ncbi:hypothetical protein LJR231_003457 [Phyllobacterium sp. LjRoot231]
MAGGLLEMLMGGGQQQQPQNPMQPAPSYGGDFLDKIRDIGAGLAMGSDPNRSVAGAGLLLAQGNQSRRKAKLGQQQANRTVDWLKSTGVGDQEAAYLATDPDALKAWYSEYKTGSKPDWQITDLFDDQGRKIKAMVDKKTGNYNQIGGAEAPNPNDKLTTDQREYQTVKDQGYTGTFLDYQKMMKEAGRNQVNIDTGVKLPTGFRWKDPNNQEAGVEPIPGGPGEQIPAESAARIGLTDSFLGQFDKIKEKVSAGKVTGVIDRFEAGYGNGEENETYRQIQSGTDALQRMLTGAGMPQSEAESYANRYLPTYRDNAKSATSKLEQLKRELESTKKLALRGRGAATTPPPAADTNNDPLGIR